MHLDRNREAGMPNISFEQTFWCFLFGQSLVQMKSFLPKIHDMVVNQHDIIVLTSLLNLACREQQRYVFKLNQDL